MTKRIAPLIILVFLTSSCSIYHVNSVDSVDAYYPPKSTHQVVYMKVVDRDHEIIGTVTVNTERRQRNIDDILAKMKREAAILGGDAITDIQTNATGTWKRLPILKTFENAYIRSNYTATVVVFK